MFAQIRDEQAAQFQSRISELEKESKYGKTYEKCDLLYCFGTDEIVAEGRIVSSDTTELVHKIPLGPNSMKILIEIPRKLDAFLWRPPPDMLYIGDVADMFEAWPADRVVLYTADQFDKKDNVSKTNSMEKNCKLYDWIGSEELVAEGRLYSTDPNMLVNNIPLGPSAMLVSIDNLKKLNAYLWRPSAGMIYVEQAVDSKVAWPESKVVVENVTAASSPPSTPINVATSSLRSANSTSKNKCKLFDVNGSGKVVAEGRLFSTNPNPNEVVHFKPLGKNAFKICVEFARISEAVLWRPTSDLTCIADSVGSIVVWLAAKVVMESSSSS